MVKYRSRVPTADFWREQPTSIHIYRPANDQVEYTDAEKQCAEKLRERAIILEELIEQIDIELSLSTSAPVVQREDFWSRLHPSVVRVSRARFEAGHHADAVESALKELNSRIKEHVRKQTGKEFDGANLMNTAFSPNNPIVRVADLSTGDGRNMQLGYMQIFAGAMTGIRVGEIFFQRPLFIDEFSIGTCADFVYKATPV